jgi:type VI secretion system protein ImpB
MSDEENSVAPIERVNLKYSSKDEGGTDVEIPLELMVIGDMSFRPNNTPVGERKPLEINKDNFDEVLAAKKIEIDVTVNNEMSSVPDAKLQTRLQVRSLKDLTPDGIVAQVPEMKRQLDLAKALQEVKADLANPAKLAALRARIDAVLADEKTRKKLEDLKRVQATEPR